MADIREHGEITLATRRRLARDAFAHTAGVRRGDRHLVRPDGRRTGTPAAHASTSRSSAPRSSATARTRTSRAPVTGSAGASSWWDTMTQHGGKALSYLNLYDTEAAWRLVHRFDDSACVVVKHANPCGVAIGIDVADAYVKANACDPVSAFGGIVAVNRTVTQAMAEPLSSVFTEVVVAPDYDDDALETLLAKKNMRVITARAAGRVAVRPEAARRWIHRATTRSGLARPVGVAGRDRGLTDRRTVGRPRVRVGRVRRRHEQRDRVRQGSAGVRDRRRSAEPARLGPHRRRSVGRSGRRRRVRERCVLPVPRRPRCGSCGRHPRRDPTRRSRSATRR